MANWSTTLAEGVAKVARPSALVNAFMACQFASGSAPDGAENASQSLIGRKTASQSLIGQKTALPKTADRADDRLARPDRAEDRLPEDGW